MKPAANGEFPQRQQIGAAERVKAGRKARVSFQAKAKTHAKSQTKNEIKREVMKQVLNGFSNNNSSSRYVVFKETASLQTTSGAGFAKKIIHERGHKNHRFSGSSYRQQQ